MPSHDQDPRRKGVLVGEMNEGDDDVREPTMNWQ